MWFNHVLLNTVKWSNDYLNLNLNTIVERSFQAGKLELMMANLHWRGVAKMHVAICFACICAVTIVAHKIGRSELANSVAASTY
jgi:hypothetical protein